MKHLKLIIFLFIIPALFSCKSEFSNMNEFKFYGFVNPVNKNDNIKYILADVDKMQKIFDKGKKSDGFLPLPKGASRYATISFDDNKKITIQIIAGGGLPFRIVKKDIWTDDWYEFDERTGAEWASYIKKLTEEIEQK